MKYNIPYIILAAAMMRAGSADAVPANPRPVEFTQPDGTKITVIRRGDERFHWIMSEDEYTLLNGQDGFLEYAEQQPNGDLRPSGIRAVNKDRRSRSVEQQMSRIQKNLPFSSRQADSRRTRIPNEHKPLRIPRRAAPTAGGSQRAAASTPTTVRMPLVLVSFLNQNFSLEGGNTSAIKAKFERLMNEHNYTGACTSANDCEFTGSVRDYFYDQSYGQLNYQVDIFGPIILSSNENRYSEDNITGNVNTNGDPRRMAVEAAKYLVQYAAAIGFDASNYDIDEDGYVDGIHIIYAGYGAESCDGTGYAACTTSTVWAHKWEIYGPTSTGINWQGTNYNNANSLPTSNGKKLNIYSCTPELYGNSTDNPNHNIINPIGTVVHELSHVFGLPDLYDNSASASNVTLRDWDIMDHGSWNDDGRTPAGHNPWSKNKMGWVPLQTLTSDMTATGVTTMPNPAIEGRAYKILTTNLKVYYLIENRQKNPDKITGGYNRWDYGVHGSGLLVYYVNETTPLEGYVNSSSSRKFYIMQAGCTSTSGCSNNRDRDPYPYNSANTFTGSNTNLTLQNITKDDAAKTVSFGFSYGAGYEIYPPYLTSLVAGTATLSPAFSNTAYTYQCTVNYSLNSITLTATAVHDSRTGNEWTSRYPVTEQGTGNKQLAVGANHFVVSAAAEFGKTDYTLNIYRKNNDAFLSYLKLGDEGTYNLPSVETYSATLPLDSTGITIEAMPHDANALIKSGTGRHNLNIGQNIIKIIVAAEDTSIKKTYTITITREQNVTLKFSGDYINTAGGLTISNMTVQANQLIASALPAPARSGYTFDRWYRDAALTNAWNPAVDLVPIQSEFTLYGGWIADRRVQFRLDGASIPDTMVKHGGSVVPPPVPLRSDAVFDRWYTDASFTKAWDFNDSAVYRDITLWGRWIFDGRVYFANITNPYSVELPIGSTVGRPFPEPDTNDSRIFDNWYKNAALTLLWDFATDVVYPDSVTLYAKWLTAVMVTFAGDDITIAALKTAQGRKITSPPTPARSGYIFDRWYKNAAFTMAWNFDVDAPSSSITLYGKWLRVGVVSFEGEDISIPQQTLAVGRKVAEPDAPARERFIFDNWYKDTARIMTWNFNKDTVTGDLTLYAKWLRAVFARFVGKNINIPMQILPINDFITRPPDPEPVSEFEGWYYDSTLTVVWKFETMRATRDTTILYAKWVGDNAGNNGATAAPNYAATQWIYPTIVSEEFMVDAEQAGRRIEIYSVNGALAGVFDANGRQTAINIARLPAGIYIVKAKGKSAKLLKK